LGTDQVQLPKQDAMANQHQPNDENEAKRQAAVDVESVQELTI
jgi:hypothetical protein